MAIAISGIALGVIAPRAPAQCPDGAKEGSCTPKLTAPRTLDANRIAILPFRTAGADPALTHLGNGIVELLSAEFNGAVGPEAVEPGEAFQAWERAGASRGPVSTAVYLRVAKALGVGQVAVGSVVGSPDRLMLSATIHNVADGAVRVALVQVQGARDSLAEMTNTLATQILGRAVGVAQGTPNDATTAYLAGMAAYRRGFRSFTEVHGHLVRASTLDSTFLLPPYQLVVVHAMMGPSLGIRGFEASFRNLWRQRHRLSNERRLLLESLADSTNLFFRQKALRRLEPVMGSLSNSAEAWNIIGDLYFHSGAAIGVDDWAERSRAALTRAMELNPALCPCAREHIADLAYFAGDVRLFTKHALGETWDTFRGAILRKNPSATKVARAEYARELSGEELGAGRGRAPYFLTGIPIPVAQVDSLLSELAPLANTDQKREGLAAWASQAANFAGRPERFKAELRKLAGSDTSSRYYHAILSATYDDSSAAEQLSKRRHEPWEACEIALSRLRRADTTGARAALARQRIVAGGLEEILADIRRGEADKPCAYVLQGVLAAVDGSGPALLLRADSLMRVMPLNVDKPNYDLAVAFARRGEFAMAAAATRRSTRGVSTWSRDRAVVSLRDGGKWSLLAGDTTAAIASFREYLIYREDPEPSLVPERDSVRALLAALERATRNRTVPKRPAPATP